MLAYILFGVGIIFITLGLLKPREEKSTQIESLDFSLEKENLSNLEKTSKEMIVHLEQLAKRILDEIEAKSSEVRTSIKEANCLLEKIERAKKEYYNLSKRAGQLTPLEEKHQKIIQLLEDGKDLVEVAKVMKMGKGEIQLVLDLGKTGWKKIETD